MKYTFTCILYLLCCVVSFGSSIEVPQDQLIIDGQGNLNLVQPGDTIVLSGTKNFLIIRNFTGTPDNPIVFTNKVGVPLVVSSELGFGISIQGCNHIKVIGRKVNDAFGIQVDAVNGTGIGVGYLSQNWEINAVEIGPTKAPGILAKTDPDCNFNSTRDKFIQEGGKILNCYIHEAGTEAIYFGSTAYNGLKVNCNGKDTILLPHFITGGEVAYNTIKNSGWDGIQVSSTLHGKVHHNTVIRDSRASHTFQKNGIITGMGFSGEVYNNLVINGEGNGIFSKGRDSLFYENNIILNPGYSNNDGGQFGIYVNIENEEAKYLQINNNLIANPRFQAFHAVIGPNVSEAIFANNVISYNDSLHGDVDDIISTPRRPLTTNAENHINREEHLETYYYRTDSLDQRENGFTTDEGIILPRMRSTDYYDRPRVDNSGLVDIGPFEFQSQSTGIINPEKPGLECQQKLNREINTLDNRLLIFDLSGKDFSSKPFKSLPTGVYLMVDPLSQCRSLIQKP